MMSRYLYVMGVGSGAGKSTVCHGILAQLLTAGYAPGQLAYIKPMTQCLAKQPVAEFCQQAGIACRDIGNLIFKNGFSRDFVDGLTPQADELLKEVLASVLEIGKGKALVIIDGVGDPAVGSIVGVANVDVALSLPCKVIFVGKPGIGAAIDSAVLGVSFMEAKGLKDIGIIFNNIPLEMLAGMTRYVSKRLPECLPDVTLLGFMPRQAAANTDNWGQWLAAYLDTDFLLYNWMGLSKVELIPTE